MRSSIFKISKNSIVFLAIISVLLIGCRDFKEQDLVNSKVSLLSPVDEYKSTNALIIFKWTQVEGARSYLFEIASPSFANGAIIFDSLISVSDSALTSERIELTFFPGNYEWRVKALNSSSSTEYSPVFDFTIDNVVDLSSENVNAVSPIGLSNTIDHTFRWQALFGADSYTVIVRENSWETGATLATATSTLDSVKIPSLKEGAFVWGVRAENATPSFTDYTRTFIEIDTTRPEPSIITFPDQDTISTGSSLTITWAHASPVGAYPTQVLDSIFVYSDSLLTLHKSYNSSALSQLVGDLNSPGKYYCRIKTYDVAGNVSPFSDAKCFVVQ